MPTGIAQLRQALEGISGILEFYALTSADAEAMVESVVAQVAGRVPVIGGDGRSVREACALARASYRAGADALMVHQPPDPFVSPRGVVDYVLRIANAAHGLPLVIHLRDNGIGLESQRCGNCKT